MDNKKPFEELELRDDFMFGIVMRKPEYCKILLERILDISIARIEYPEDQKTINLDYDARSVRLDIFVQDNDKVAYTIEMQTSDKGNLPQRCRYYTAMTDLNLIDKGEDYKNLPKNIVIFICTFDLFEKNRYIYRFENRCVEEDDLLLNDGTLKIFLNTKGAVGEISKELKALLEYIDSGSITDSYTKKLDQEVISAKNNRKWRVEYVTVDMMIKEEREEALEEGRVEGRIEGMDKIKALVKLLIADGRIDELSSLDENSEKLLEEYGIK